VIASELAQPIGLVRTTDTLLDAARRLVAEALPGLAVVSDDGRPLAVLPASQVVGLAVPAYIKDDPSLARVVDEATADRLVDGLADLTVQSVLDDAEPDLLGTVRHDATLLEVAVLMSRLHVPLLVVAGPDGKALGTVTAQAVLGAGLAQA
jgi:predicted transcriptional regulator